MRISDWSSDVCSSDLILFPGLAKQVELGLVCAQDGAVPGDPVQRHRAVLEEVLRVLLVALSLGFRQRLTSLVLEYAGAVGLAPDALVPRAGAPGVVVARAELALNDPHLAAAGMLPFTP